MNRRTALTALSLTLTAALVASSAPARAAINDLVAFLERADRMATGQKPVRADVTWKDSDGSTGRCVVYLDPASGGRQLLAAEASGFRSETPLGWEGEGRAVRGAGAKPEKIGVDDVLGDCGLRGIDFFPFWKTDYTTAFISDQNHRAKTVSLYAADERPYKLYVIEFDIAKMVPLTMKFYRAAFNDLVRVRTDSGHVLAGARPRPTKIEIRRFPENASRTYTLEWSSVESVPEDFLSGTPVSAGVGAGGGSHDL